MRRVRSGDGIPAEEVVGKGAVSEVLHGLSQVPVHRYGSCVLVGVAAARRGREECLVNAVSEGQVGVGVGARKADFERFLQDSIPSVCSTSASLLYRTLPRSPSVALSDCFFPPAKGGTQPTRPARAGTSMRAMYSVHEHSLLSRVHPHDHAGPGRQVVGTDEPESVRQTSRLISPRTR